jgi:hypothetical protein
MLLELPADYSPAALPSPSPSVEDPQQQQQLFLWLWPPDFG